MKKQKELKKINDGLYMDGWGKLHPLHKYREVKDVRETLEWQEKYCQN